VTFRLDLLTYPAEVSGWGTLNLTPLGYG